MNRYILTALSIVVLGLVIQVQSAHGQTAPNNNNNPQQMKTRVDRFGTGEKARVTVRKNDGTKLKGYINRTSDEAFDLTDAKTRQATTIAYSDVSKIMKSGMSKGVKIAIIGGVVAAAVVVVVAIAAKEALDDLCILGPCAQ